MKNLLLITAGLLFMLGACVDDYTDSNPPHKLDAPNVRVSTSGDQAAVVPAGLTGFEAYVIYGEPIDFTVSVIDAPGVISAASISSSVEEFGTVELDEASFNAVKGKTSGEFKFTLIPSTELPDMATRTLNVTLTVSDSQLDKKGESSPLTTSLTIPVSLINGPCVTTGLATGTYKIVAASGTHLNTDGDEESFTYDSLIKYSPAAFAANTVVVVIDEVRPGVYSFSDVTGGLTSIDYDFPGSINVNLCGSDLAQRAGANVQGTAFFAEGTVNTDGTIDITWSWGDGPENGSYTLKKLY